MQNNLKTERQFLDENLMKKSLLLFGLTEDEANTFVTLVNKLVIPEDEFAAIDQEFESGLPFEGGMASGEALICLYISRNE